MAQEAPARTKIPTKAPQLLHSAAGRPKKGSHTARSWVIASGSGRATTRGCGEVIELECGITVCPAREEQGRWRAVWKLDATDVSRMAGHANYRITLDMHVGTTAGVLDRARTATQ